MIKNNFIDTSECKNMNNISIGDINHNGLRLNNYLNQTEVEDKRLYRRICSLLMGRKNREVPLYKGT